MQTLNSSSNGAQRLNNTSNQIQLGTATWQNTSPKMLQQADGNNSSGGAHSNNENSSSNAGNGNGSYGVQFNQIRLQSEVLELIQTLSLDYDQLSPVEVRQQLRKLVQAEQEARGRRETYLNEILSQRIQSEQHQYKNQFNQLHIQFELETIKFEKVLKDRAQAVIKSLQIKQLDRLINLVGRIRQIHNLHGASCEEPSRASETCIKTQDELQKLISDVDKMMAELSSDESNSHALSEAYNIVSQEELQRKIGCTPFNANLKDQIYLLQQHSSNGVVANNNRMKNNQAVVPGAHNNDDSLGPQKFAAATSYGGITSGDGLPITSGSNILSPNTTPSQEFGNPPGEATLSNPQIQRSNTTAANQFVQPGGKRPHFVYDLPPDFPFNEALIEKSLSSNLTNSAFKSGSQGNDRGGNGGSNSQHTASNHDVNPEDVLRTFTNSLHSGGTLGAIHSSLTYYKEALVSKEWSNLSPSNAYQNFMWKKNLVGEIQKLAKEISRIPTEEAKILADLSKSHLSQEGSRRHISHSNYHLGNQQRPQQFNSGQLGQQPPKGMTTAEAISKGLGFIGNNESSILMDLNRASIVAAQKEAEELKQKAKRIVDDSATRLEPVVKSFTDAPINQQLLQSANLNHNGSGGSNQNQRFIQYRQEPSSSLPDSQGFFNGQQLRGSLENNPYDNQRAANNESMMRDSCVMYDDTERGNFEFGSAADLNNQNQKSPGQTALAHLNYHASNERSQLSEDEDGIVDEVMHQQRMYGNNNHHQTPQQPRHGLIAQAVQNKINSQHRRHGSVVVGEHTIQNRLETNQAHEPGHAKKDGNGRELLNVYAERRSIQHERDELSPKQLRNESLSVQRSSIAAKRKVQQMGFFSNDAATNQFTDVELEQIEKAQNFQQTTSFAPKNKTPWWLEDAHEIQQNQVLFQQTAGPNMQGRNALAAKLQSSRRRGTQSVNSQYPSNYAQQNASGQTISYNQNSRFGDQNLSNTVLDNKGRAIGAASQHHQDGQVNSGNLYDELSRVAEYQSSRSVLDGQSQKALHRNAANQNTQQKSNLNRTMQIKNKKQGTVRRSQNTGQIVGSSAADQNGTTTTGTNREHISKSVLTNNGDRASPIPSSTGAGGAKVPKMNIKKTQIKLVGGIQNKRASIQVAGSTSTGGGQQSKSVSREGRIKVKLVQKQSTGVPTPIAGANNKHTNVSQITDPNVSRLSSVNNGGIGSVNTSQSPKMSRNGQRVVLATGPAKSTQGHHIPTGVTETKNSRQRELSPQHQTGHPQTNLVNFQHAGQGTYSNKIPFKSIKDKREEASQSGPHGIHNNNFFNEGAINVHNPNEMDEEGEAHQKRQIANISQLSAPTGLSHQPLKIRRNRKQAKRMTPTLEDSKNAEAPASQIQPAQVRESSNSAMALEALEEDDKCVKEEYMIVEEKEAAEQHFNEIARNLRNAGQSSTIQAAPVVNNSKIFIRKGSHHQQPYQNASVNASMQYGAGSVQASANQESSGQGKSRQGTFVRTYKQNKSRQVEDLERPFITERVSFHKSALVNNQGSRKNNNMTHEDKGAMGEKVPSGYKRPIGSVNASHGGSNQAAGTVRVQSHSQPPLADHYKNRDQILEQPQIIPPPTQNEMMILTDQQREETTSTPGQMSGRGSVSVNAKRPVYKMTAINFIGTQGNSDESQSNSTSAANNQTSKQLQAHAQVSNFVNAQNPQTSSQFSFHHPQQAQPSQGKFSTSHHGKKPSITAQLETSPYLTQQKVSTGQSSAAQSAVSNSKRVIHLKRPSTNLQMASSNQPSLIAGSKNAFAQRAASRVEQIDKQHELSFQNNQGNAGTISGSSAISAIQRPTTQIRIGKKTSVGGTQQTQVVIGASRTNGNFMRPPSDMSNGDGEYSYM